MIMPYCETCRDKKGLLTVPHQVHTKCLYCGQVRFCYDPFMPDFDKMYREVTDKRRIEKTLQLAMEKEHVKMLGILVRYQTFFIDIRDHMGMNFISEDDEELFEETHEILEIITGRS